MLLSEAVKLRLSALPDLAGLIEEAGEWDAVFATPARLQGQRRCFVIPLGRDAQPPRAGTVGSTTQLVTHHVGVFLALRQAGDATGQKLSAATEALVNDIVALISGWRPDGFDDVMHLTRARLVDLTQGVMFTQVSFSVTQHERTFHV